jgi:hypothetical protein
MPYRQVNEYLLLALSVITFHQSVAYQPVYLLRIILNQ